MVVNGSAPAYGQPVWVPGPAPQSAPMMRSPYPAQLMPYPSPGGPVPMYPSPMGPPHPPGMHPQNHHPHPPPQNANIPNQGRPPPPGMPLVSPVMQPAMAVPPMYAGSPVLVHTPPGMQPGQAYAVPGQPPRGPAPMHVHRSPYEQNSAGPPPPPHMAPPMRPQQNYAPGPIPANYGARPPW